MRHSYQIWVCFAATLLLVFLSLGPQARAQKDNAPTRNLGVHINKNHLETSFGFHDVFTSSIRQKLNSGLPTRVVLQMNLERQGVDTPVSYWVRTTSIVYDLWEESYIVTVEDSKGRRQAKAKTPSKAVALAATLSSCQVARVNGLPPGNYRLRTVIEVNPVSKEMIANIRRWLARPSSASSGPDSQSNFFGSFVGVFVDRRIGQADHSVTFVSQWFRLGES